MVKYYFRFSIFLAFVSLVLWALYKWETRATTASTAPSAHAVLPKEDREQLIVDTRHHTITIVKAEGTEIQYLPEVPTTVDIRKDGTVRVMAQKWGPEIRPFIGLAFSDNARFGIGVDILYWHRFNLGAGIAPRVDFRDGRGFVSVDYNLVDNLYVSIGVDHKKTPQAMLSMRF